METKKLARVLRVLVDVVFVCNLVILPFVPGLVGVGAEGGLGAIRTLAVGVGTQTAAFLAACWQYLFRVWRNAYTGVLAGFLLFCGINTALILWEARRVLGTVVAGLPFQRSNAESMRRAAISFGLISLAALCRTVWGFFYYRSVAPLFTYNALFVPVFAMGCLLCLVMSALFGQAAELKEDSDLTI